MCVGGKVFLASAFQLPLAWTGRDFGYFENTSQSIEVGRKDAASIRRSDFAGTWYPGEESVCRQAIEEFDKTTAPCPQSDKPMVGGIVPHAGWYYSGRIACHVIKCLKSSTMPEGRGMGYSPGES